MARKRDEERREVLSRGLVQVRGMIHDADLPVDVRQRARDSAVRTKQAIERIDEGKEAW